MHLSERQDIEIELFVRALKLRHGYDFSGYAPASLKRRVMALLASGTASTISEMTQRLIHDECFIEEVIGSLSVPVSEMFRDPAIFRLLREEVAPLLGSWPQINIWQAGCAHGEEVYSLAILLKETGLYNRAQIFATDFSDRALAKAQEGIYPLREARLYSENYQKSGGSGSLSDWYTAMYNYIKLDGALRERITFANHNLVSDGVFGEMHLILCRNVLIYFGNELQNHVLGLFRDSLVRGGFLCIGSKEALSFSAVARDFRSLRVGAPVYRRVANV